LTSTGALAADADIARAVNALRSPRSPCLAAPGLKQLVRRPSLDRAAAQMLGGAPFEDSVWQVGYRPDTVKGFYFSGSADSAVLQRLLATAYCPSITDPELVDIGVYQREMSTWLLMAKHFAPAAGLDAGELAVRLLTLANQVRAESRRCGDQIFRRTGPVTWNEALERAAREHAQDMASSNYFGHDALDGTTPSQRIKRAGYVSLATGENIAAGQMTAEQAMEDWVKSPGHCAILMDPEFTEMGVALATNAKSKHGAYWAQEFGAPRPLVRRKDRG